MTDGRPAFKKIVGICASALKISLKLDRIGEAVLCFGFYDVNV